MEPQRHSPSPSSSSSSSALQSTSSSASSPSGPSPPPTSSSSESIHDEGVTATLVDIDASTHGSDIVDAITAHLDTVVSPTIIHPSFITSTSSTSTSTSSSSDNSVDQGWVIVGRSSASASESVDVGQQTVTPATSVNASGDGTSTHSRSEDASGTITAVWVPHHRYQDEDEEEAEDESEAGAVTSTTEGTSSGGSGAGDRHVPRQVTFDRDLPSHHLYLGEEEDVASGKSSVRMPTREDGVFELPILPLHDVVLFPGELLPLRMFHPGYSRLLRQMISDVSRPSLFGVIAVTRKLKVSSRPDRDGNQDITAHLGRVGTVAEIRYVKKEAEGHRMHSFNVIAIGRHRIEVFKAWKQCDGIIKAKVRVINDHENPTRIPQVLVPENKGATSAARDEGKASGTQPPRKGAAGTFPYWVYRMYDVDELCQRAKSMLEENIHWRDAVPADPTAFSFWLARSLPLDNEKRQELLELSCSADRLREEIRIMEHTNQICCDQCGSDLANKNDIFSMSFEGPVGIYVNPGGHVHQLLTLKRAHGIRLRGHPSSEATWFPGYEWTAAFCESCGCHLGWRFAALDTAAWPQHFWGLRRCNVSQDLTGKVKLQRREETRRQVVALYPDAVRAVTADPEGYQSG